MGTSTLDPRDVATASFAFVVWAVLCSHLLFQAVQCHEEICFPQTLQAKAKHI